MFIICEESVEESSVTRENPRSSFALSTYDSIIDDVITLSMHSNYFAVEDISKVRGGDFYDPDIMIIV